MYFDHLSLSADVAAALTAAGYTVTGRMLYVPESDCLDRGEDWVVIQGIRLIRRQITFAGHRERPTMFSTLTGIERIGVELYQCPTCGYWLSEKMTMDDEKMHERVCSPRYEWALGQSEQ